MVNVLNKIDKGGRFTKFPGASVIAFLQNSELRNSIFNRLNNNAVTKYYSVLPSSSLHVTGSDLFIESGMGNGDWLRFVDSKLSILKRLAADLNENPLALTLKVKDYIIDGVLQIRFETDPLEIQQLKAVFEKYNLEYQVPSILHLTLAYEYRTTILYEEIAPIEVLMEQLINDLKNADLTLEPMSLCFFHSMTQFTPWNGMSNPFRPPSVISRLLAFLPKIHDSTTTTDDSDLSHDDSNKPSI